MAEKKKTDDKKDKLTMEMPAENTKVLMAFSEYLLKQADKSQKQEEEFEKIEAAGGIVEKDSKTGKYKVIPNNLLNQEQKDKKVARIAALWNIANQSMLERDKQILTLSALAIGGLLVFLQAGFSTKLSFIFWTIAIISFLVSVILSLETLRNNYIGLSSQLFYKENKERLCSKCKNHSDDLALDNLMKLHECIEKWTYRLFLLGIFFTILFALYQSGLTFQLPPPKKIDG